MLRMLNLGANGTIYELYITIAFHPSACSHPLIMVSTISLYFDPELINFASLVSFSTHFTVIQKNLFSKLLF